MRRFLEKLAVMGERAAPVLWAVLCVLLCLALCLDAVWWQSLPLGVALLGLARAGAIRFFGASPFRI